ncbi:MAG: dihydroxyacetone kinase subunit L [Clostridiaceae bacterium]|jgi:dihydroxyacetone kinase-like protein|nr:dihydroxyacetone kinase subunit L [Clostridiaceae bacterium]
MELETLVSVISQMQKNIAENREYLSDLDRAIGDGDHGINMDRGFREVMKKLESSSVNTPADLLRTVGMTLAFKVGGAAGPLYGTAFMKASEAVKGKETLLLDDLLPMLEFAIEGIQLRGKAVRGEKTMLDALIPAKEALDQALAEGLAGDDALDAMIKAAEEGAEYTKTIIATKGRASYVGERSIGHMDPGAASSCLLLHAIKTY